MEPRSRPVTAGVLSALVGFTSSSAVALAGLRGDRQPEAAGCG